MYEVKVNGMTCGSCASSIRHVVKRVDPDAEVEVNIKNQTVQVKTKESAVTIAKLIEESGFPVVSTKTVV